MSDLSLLQKEVRDFVDSRDWRKFQNTKELALSIIAEASEMLQLFLWKDASEIEDELKKNGDLLYHVKSELADVLFGCLAMADQLNLDLEGIFRAKLDELKKRYPVDEVRGRVVKRMEGAIEFHKFEK